MKKQNYKTALDEIAEDYEMARDCKFDEELMSLIKDMKECEWVITEDDIKVFLDNFNFPDENEWCEKEYAEQIGAFEDVKYNEIKDKR